MNGQCHLAYLLQYTSYHNSIESRALRNRLCVVRYYACSSPALLAIDSHLPASTFPSTSLLLPLGNVVPLLSALGPSVNTIRRLSLVEYVDHSGDLESLNVFGSPERTKESQYAMSSEAKAFSVLFWVVKVVVPLNLCQ